MNPSILSAKLYVTVFTSRGSFGSFGLQAAMISDGENPKGISPADGWPVLALPTTNHTTWHETTNTQVGRLAMHLRKE